MSRCGRVFQVDIAPIRLQGMLDEARGDRSRLDQRDVNARAGQFDAQHVGQSLDGELGGAIGASIGRRDQPEHRGALDDAPLSLRPHRRDHAARQVVPTDDIGLELSAQHLGRHVLDGAGLAISPVIEQCIERAVRRREHMVRGCGDRLRLRIVEIEALQPVLVLQPCEVLRRPRRGEHTPAARLHRARRGEPDARRAAGDEDGALDHESALTVTLPVG